MLDKTGTRQLCYVVKIDSVEPIAGKDRVECARVGGWTCMVPKDAFKAGDPGIYFEIDSQVPLDNPVFEFCKKYKGHIKTQKFKTPDGQFWSQGLLMPASDFGWTIDRIDVLFITDDKMVRHTPGTESAFLTQQLGVTYYEPEDQKRKSKPNPDARINAAFTRHPWIARKFGRFIKKYKWARKIFLLLFGKKKDVKTWPSWVVKTDEERIENLPNLLHDKTTEWYATEKIDGTSTTFTMKGWGRKREFYICSRNVVFDRPNKQCYYDTNVYIEMAEKYNIEHVLECLMEYFENTEGKIDFITIQGETYGEGIQKRDYSLKEHKLMVFNVIIGINGQAPKRLNPREMTNLLEPYDIPCVPILNEAYILPDTIEELRAFVDSEPSKIDNKIKEGIVFRSNDGVRSFKCVSPEFLIKYHS